VTVRRVDHVAAAAAAVLETKGVIYRRNHSKNLTLLPACEPTLHFHLPLPVTLRARFYYSAPVGEPSSDEHVCLSLSVCVCVCLFASIFLKLHIRSSPSFCACYFWPVLGPPVAA